MELGGDFGGPEAKDFRFENFKVVDENHVGRYSPQAGQGREESGFISAVSGDAAFLDNLFLLGGGFDHNRLPVLRK